MADSGLTTRIPIWVRVSGIIALVLVGVVISSMLLGGSISESHEGGRGPGSQTERTDHSGGQTGPAAPFESVPSQNPAPSDDQTPRQEGGPSHVRPKH